MLAYLANASMRWHCQLMPAYTNTCCHMLAYASTCENFLTQLEKYTFKLQSTFFYNWCRREDTLNKSSFEHFIKTKLEILQLARLLATTSLRSPQVTKHKTGGYAPQGDPHFPGHCLCYRTPHRHRKRRPRQTLWTRQHPCSHWLATAVPRHEEQKL